MESGQLDEQFDRAVEIVQGLPKTGPIQTGYEEKLAMYSLYKQATVGDVTGARPNLWDMLGKAKWDAWEKQRGLDSQQAKYLYVETLQKVLRKYSDRTVARDLVQELDSYVTDPSSLVMIGGLAPSDDGDSSSRSVSPVRLSNVNRRSQQFIQANQLQQLQQQIADAEQVEQVDTEQDNREEHDIVAPPSAAAPVVGRPPSAVSSHMRYRTPLANTGGYSPSTTPSILPTPPSQPIPRFATPSAFVQQHPGPLPPPPSSSASYPTSLSYAPHPTSPNLMRHPYNPSTSYRRSSIPSEMPPSLIRPPLERAVESLQATLAALHERMDSLEAFTYGRTPGSSFPPGARGGNGSPASSSHYNRASLAGSSLPFDPSQTGAWSVVLRPLCHAIIRIQEFLTFLFHPPNPSTATARLIIIRRLLLDASFVLSALALLRMFWRMTGIRRKEVFRALMGVWYAMTGTQSRILVDKGV